MRSSSTTAPTQFVASGDVWGLGDAHILRLDVDRSGRISSFFGLPVRRRGVASLLEGTQVERRQQSVAALMLATVTRDHIMTTSLATTLTLIRIEAGAAKILIDPCLSGNPSWDKGWIGSRAGEDSTQGGGR
jgi:hypothetical protein